MGTCIDYPRGWGVGTLLIRVSILGNEVLENRNERNRNVEEIVRMLIP